MARPLLDNVELQQVQEMETEQDQVLVQHGVPALEGDFLQRQDRRSTQVTLTGVLTGPEVADGLKTLREKFRAAQPVPFVTDITTATKVDQVLIEEMGVRELAGKPERFEYAFTLREFIAPPAEETEEPPQPEQVDEEITQDSQQQVNETVEDVAENIGTLEVEIIVEGDSNFDLSTTMVTVEGTPDDGEAPLSRTLTAPSDNVWRDESMLPGSYIVRAVTGTEPALAGSVQAVIRRGQTTRVQIVLSQSRPANVAVTFVVHFRFDKSFVEPCMRPALRQVANYASDHRDEKLIILGHTDRVGPPDYNQSLSERRARAVYSYLTFGHDRSAALAEWDQLRQTRPRGTRLSINDSWDVREYQHILQDLGFYPGPVDGDDGPLTREAVRAYRCHKGLPPGTTVDPDTWQALIEDYLSQDNLTVPADRFLPNCPDEVIKWLGCGEEDPVRNTGSAWRPNRRTELLFVRASSLPCQVPQPDTFNLPPPGTVNSNWCVGPATGTDHCCFVTVADSQRQAVTRDANAFMRTPAEPGTFTVEGLIQRELPNGTLQPVPNQAFVLISPMGEFKGGEQSNGEPSPARTNASGQFSFANLPAGFYSLEVITPANRPVQVRLLDEPNARISGNVVCRELHVPSPGGPNPRLDVVIVNAPVLREIRLPTVAHLMTALHPGTREIRVCPSPIGPPGQQKTTLNDTQIQTAFDEANHILRQARIYFVLTDIVREAYAFRTECEVDQNEFTILLERCAYPDAANVFFVGDLAGAGEAGFGLSVENGAAAGLPGGCAVGDRFQTTVLGPPLSVSLTDQQREQVLAHELGHYLNLDHVTVSSANADRLMLPGTSAGDNRTLISDEINRARSSQGASDDCVPLALKVTGATQVGGTLSHQYIFVQHPELIDPFDITIDAQIPDRLLTRGVLTMTGGNPGASSLQRTVSKSAAGEFDIVATYTPASSGQPATSHVLIRVATFRLFADGSGGNTFVTSRHPTDVVTVRVDLAPAPFCIPNSLVTWTGGNEAPDPLRRTVNRASTGSTTVTAAIAGETRSITITVIEVRIPAVTLVGLNQTTDIPIIIDPSPLPTGVSITLQLRRTSGTGEARFVSTNSTSMTITQTTTVTIRGITASSVADNIRLNATMTGRPEVIAQEDFTVVGVAIGSVMGVRPGQTIDIPITVTPSPLPPGGTLTLELRTTSGTGEATFVGGNPTTMTINQSTTVTVQGITASSTADNIRLTARITGQTQILAQEDFTVLNRINIFLKFEVWNLDTRTFEPLPAGVPVDLMDFDPIGPNDQLAAQRTDAQGRVLFSLSDFGTSGEDEPDLFFLVRPNGLFHAGHLLPEEWSTKGWRATDGSPGFFDEFTGTQLGTEAAPLTYRIGLDFHARLTYHVDQGGRAGLTDPAPIGSGISFFVGGERRRTFLTDVNGEVHGVIFNVEGGDSVSIGVDFDIRDPGIKMNLARVDIDPWETEFDDNDQTSIAADAAPLALLANSDDRNVALYILKQLRELSTFLFHLTGGAWTGFDNLEFNRSSISGVAFSWPVGTVNLPPADHWDRGTMIHEITHQTMWKEHDRSSADIAFEALFGDLALTHREDLLNNPEHALIEGWAEFLQAIFARNQIPPYFVNPVVNSDGSNPRPLGPPPNNRGESVEGAFANGLLGVFENHMVTSAVFSAAGAVDAHVPESSDGNILTTAPWINNPAVRTRFLSMIWDPFRDLRTRDKTTTQMFARMRVRNASVWHQLQAELQAFNMAMDVPTITSVNPSSGSAAGGQAVTITGTNFVPGTQVRFAQPPPGGGLATNVVITSSSALTALTPAGAVGSANVIVTTPAGSDTRVNGYTYV